MEGAQLGRLTSEFVVYLAVLCQLWDYSYTLPRLPFILVLEDQNSDPHTCKATTLFTVRLSSPCARGLLSPQQPLAALAVGGRRQVLQMLIQIDPVEESKVQEFSEPGMGQRESGIGCCLSHG